MAANDNDKFQRRGNIEPHGGPLTVLHFSETHRQLCWYDECQTDRRLSGQQWSVIEAVLPSGQCDAMVTKVQVVENIRT